MLCIIKVCVCRSSFAGSFSQLTIAAVSLFKGVTQYRNGDIVGAGHSFGTILDAIEEDSRQVTPEVAFVLNAIGSIHFSNKMYDKAIEFYTESLDKSNRHDLHLGSLSNIATAYFMSKSYVKSEKYYNEAIMSADMAGADFVSTKALVMSKLAYVIFKRKMYHRAFDLYNEGEFACYNVIF